MIEGEEYLRLANKMCHVFLGDIDPSVAYTKRERAAAILQERDKNRDEELVPWLAEYMENTANIVNHNKLFWKKKARAAIKASREKKEG